MRASRALARSSSAGLEALTHGSFGPLFVGLKIKGQGPGLVNVRLCRVSSVYRVYVASGARRHGQASSPSPAATSSRLVSVAVTMTSNVDRPTAVASALEALQTPWPLALNHMILHDLIRLYIRRSYILPPRVASLNYNSCASADSLSTRWNAGCVVILSVENTYL